MTNPLLTFIVFLLLSDRFGIFVASVALVAFFLSPLVGPIVGWWVDCGRAFLRRLSAVDEIR